MRPCWAPQSALLFEPPLSFASASLVRTLVAAHGELPLIYAGDRMWPALRHGQGILLRRPSREDLAPGRLFVAEAGGIPELLRIETVEWEALILVAGAYERIVLTLARLGVRRAPEGTWGASHSRWIDREGGCAGPFP